MRTNFRSAIFAAAITVACGGSKPATTTPNPDVHPLVGIAGQNIIIAPVQSLRVPAELGWPAIPSRPTLMHLDSVFADTLKERVGNRAWVYADGVVQSAANNAQYATDPRAL